MASEYALLLIPNTKPNKCDVKLVRRHVTQVPGPGSTELAYDTTLDPEAYKDSVTLAGELAKLISNGRRYQAVRDTIVSNLGDAVDIVLDLKGGTPEISESSRHGLYEVALNRLRCIGKAVGINM